METATPSGAAAAPGRDTHESGSWSWAAETRVQETAKLPLE